VPVHHSFGCVFNGKTIASPHWVVCTIAWLKRWPNIFVWLILHGLGQVAMIFKTIGTIIFTKHTYGKDNMCFVKDIWKVNENAWNITLHQVWQRWLFINGVLISFCGGKFLCMFMSNGVSTSFCSPSKKSHTHACVMYAISIDILFVPPMPCLGSPHQIHIWKRGFYYVLDLN